MRRLAILSATAVAFAVTLTACDDDPFRIDWELSPDTMLLYSLARPELNLPTAFNVNFGTFVSIEQPGATGSWDFAVDTRDGALVFVPPGGFGLDSESAIAPITGQTFDGIREAPADTAAYVKDRPVPVEVNALYVIQSDEQPGAFGLSCLYYGKVQVLQADPVVGSVLFRFDASPVCNDRSLVPPGT